MRVMVVMGTRPEVIKLAPVIAALRSRIEVLVCATGQHREMLEQALAAFDLSVDIRLDCMRPQQSLNALAARVLAEMDAVLEAHVPDWVIVQGDTTTAFCAGLAAFHRGIQVGHVEAGLRTGDLASPFPEEANRQLLGRIAARHFAPTSQAAENLLREGVATSRLTVTGNTVVDAIAMVRRGWEAVPPMLPIDLDPETPLVLVTCHRRENFGDVILGICRALRVLCQRYPRHRWVFPVHLNPAVREPVMRELGGIANLSLVEPVNYRTSLYLISRSRLVISDSGGIQEEAPSFGVPVVVMRNHTERMEGVAAGFATLAGQNPDAIVRAASDWLDDTRRRNSLRDRPNPYGDGAAATRILAVLCGEPGDSYHG